MATRVARPLPQPRVPDTEARLSEVLSEFARTLLTDFSIEQILDHLVVRIVDLLPVDAAGVSLLSPVSQPELIAGSDDSAIRFEQLQTALEEGPCIAAYKSDGPISIPRLAEDHRYPRYAERALSEGLEAVFAFPLSSGDRRLGALSLYRGSAGALDADDLSTAQTLADVTTAYLLNAEARQARTEFVATVAHELRTPMTSIAGFVELLRDEDAGALTRTQSHLLDVISRNGDRLTSLADDLLMLSRLEAGTSSRDRSLLDLGDVVRAAQAELRPIIDARDLEVVFDVPAAPLHLRGDAASLESLVTNLMTNAVKFTQDGGRVRCRLVGAGERAVLEVSDNGLGIPEEEQTQLFTRFFRSSTAYEHAIPGSGLGLTIVESVVHTHGGEISLESRHLGGTTFTVTLPLAERHLTGVAS